MSKTNTTFGIKRGAMADTIAKQVADQGYAIDAKSADHFQLDAEAIDRLRIRGLLTEVQSRSANTKLVARIAKATTPADTGGCAFYGTQGGE